MCLTLRLDHNYLQEIESKPGSFDPRVSASTESSAAIARARLNAGISPRQYHDRKDQEKAWEKEGVASGGYVS